MFLKQAHPAYCKIFHIATAARCALIAGLWVFLAAAICWPPGMVWAEEQTGAVRQVINAKSFVLEDGDTVRLAAIQAPNVEETDGQHRPGEPMGEEAKAFLETLVLGKAVRLMLLPEPRDRHNRLVAQAYLADGRWVQGELLKAGMAMVYPFADSGPKVAEMLTLEKEARDKGVGIWGHPYYAVIDHTAAEAHTDHFKLVEGTVRKVAEVRGNTYLNFEEDWKTDFTAFIGKNDAKYFKSMDLKVLEGKRVRVRGWIYFHNGPAVDLTAPGQVEAVR